MALETLFLGTKICTLCKKPVKRNCFVNIITKLKSVHKFLPKDSTFWKHLDVPHGSAMCALKLNAFQHPLL